MIESPIINSILDQDLYTFTVGQLAYFNFPNVNVSYEFINRNKTSFPENFAIEIKNQIQLMSKLKLNESEKNWLSKLPFIKSEYANWLSNYRFDPNELTIEQSGKILKVNINGNWARTIMYEVPILALISELYFILTNKLSDIAWTYRIIKKAQNLSNNNCKWMDFGTRRRFSYNVQEAVVKTMKNYNGFLGTSNCYLAYKYGINSMGTMSHQFPMILSALYGVKDANKQCLKQWEEFYKDLLIYLPDTFTTDVFLRDFDYETALVWGGLRQDSGDPCDWMDNKIIPHYQKLGVSLKNKKIIFSDNLTDEKFKQLTFKYKDVAHISGGIGTFLTNDCGNKPLNIVIKAIKCNDVNIIKLSDNSGKHTGKLEEISRIKKELNLKI